MAGFYLPDSDEHLESRIKDDGTVSLPSLGKFVAAGKTFGELHSELVKKYPRIHALFPSGGVYHVGGEVVAPGLKRHTPGLKILHAIRAAGGFTEFANKKRVALRRANGQNIMVKVGDSPQDDALVLPGDSIFVRRRGAFGR